MVIRLLTGARSHDLDKPDAVRRTNEKLGLGFISTCPRDPEDLDTMRRTNEYNELMLIQYGTRSRDPQELDTVRRPKT